MMVTGLNHATPMAVEGLGEPPALDVSAIVTGGFSVPGGVCPGGGVNDTDCLVGLQEVKARADARCSRFVVGSSLADLRPVPIGSSSGGGRKEGNASRIFCLRSAQVFAAVPGSGEGSVALAWDLPVGDAGPGQQEEQQRQHRSPSTCLALVSFPGMQVGPTVSVDSAATVLYDSKSNSILTVGFSGAQMLIITVFDAATLEARSKYRLPLSVAWLLHAPRVSSGFLLFVGSEQPFVGTNFIIDLMTTEIYEQDPPPAVTMRRRKGRRRLPHAMFFESLYRGSQTSEALSRRCASGILPSTGTVGAPERGGNGAK